MRFALLLSILLFVLSRCGNNADVRHNDPSTENLYYDYQVMAEEGGDSATVLLQFRPGDAEGDAVAVAGSRVSFDGKALRLDSTPNGSYFYEAVRPLSGFAGKHTIRLADAQGKKHDQLFEFMPLQLVQEVGETVQKVPFILRLKGLPAGGLIHLVITDTSFASPDVNEELRLRGDSLPITQTMLNALVAGPVVLHLQAETEQSIQGNNQRGGRLVVTTSLKREFELVER